MSFPGGVTELRAETRPEKIGALVEVGRWRTLGPDRSTGPVRVKLRDASSQFCKVRGQAKLFYDHL